MTMYKSLTYYFGVSLIFNVALSRFMINSCIIIAPINEDPVEIWTWSSQCDLLNDSGAICFSTTCRNLRVFNSDYVLFMRFPHMFAY